jgi:hypothetical protein
MDANMPTLEDTVPKGHGPMEGERTEVDQGAWLIYVHAGGGRAYLANYLCLRDREGRLEVNFGAKLLTEPANAREAHKLVLAKLTSDRSVEAGWTDHRVEIRTLMVEVVKTPARSDGAIERSRH